MPVALSDAGTRPAGTCVPRGTATARAEAAQPRRKRGRGPPGALAEGRGAGAAAGAKCEADAAIALLKEPGLAVPSYRPCNPVSQQSPFRKSFISL